MATTTLRHDKGAVALYDDWFEQARHGDVMVYFTGDLMAARDTLEAVDINDPAQEETFRTLTLVDTIAVRAASEAKLGLVALTQQRMGENNYRYRATRIRPERERLRQAAEQSDAAGV